ncbi:MAG: class I SAM-dependent methyltransferase [Deltaproteobacteria bacterium]|nr:class I SAM-dependent methyltransferase [Deltaproteobacteria bacterium]
MASSYARFRPNYPQAMFRYLATTVTSRERAWDCATGTGQAALGLAAHFHHVVATDGSRLQIVNALPHGRIDYAVTLAESNGIRSSSMDLIVVAQAIHWFDLDRFYPEVHRILKPGGTLAVWCYGLLRIDDETNAVVDRFYREVVGPYWPEERKWVESAYASLPFPFQRLKPPSFFMESRWDLSGLLGYLNTWSAVRRFREEKKRDPVELIIHDLNRAWGSQTLFKAVRWPLHLLVGKPDECTGSGS